MVPLWRRYLDGIPEYLARHYWWAYLAPRGVWFFDHQPIINIILFGQYHAILREIMRHYDARPPGRTLQLTCAYGVLTPALAMSPATRELHLMDAADIQLRAARRKLPDAARPARVVRMNAEALGYADDSFDTAIIFFLLHELPPDARSRALREAARVVKPGGSLLIADYGANEGRHFLHRFAPARRLLERLEPFLGSFWHDDLDRHVAQALAHNGKAAGTVQYTAVLHGFYRVLAYRVREA